MVTFPHCSCDARKNGHVIVSISLRNFRLQACSEDGDLQVCAWSLLTALTTLETLAFGSSSISVKGPFKFNEIRMVTSVVPITMAQ